MKKTILGLLLLIPSTCFAYGTNGCDSSTVLLIHCNGAPASTSFSESDCQGNGAIAITAQADSKIDATGKFEQSVILDGTGDYLQSATIGTTFSGDFTVDFWVNFATDISALTTDLYDDNASFTNFSARIQATVRDLFIGGNEYTFGLWTPTAGTWYHVAIVRSGSTVTWYQDGVSQGTATDTSTPTVGVMNFAFRVGIGEYLNGELDEIRVSTRAQWTANFTPPTSQYCSGCEMMGALWA